ncbi:hypothetical protein [Clostridium weizhouense]|uniref:Uncharacterized protein n=1 Tax=Clostridium weizhouense TaxID=2859781 RepID=A0ABS7AT99_9CLOT|nr:hypothetical protein [Clostridium weizhouense]MBW6410700.1 hypothetical protein [Clostridium weizhouense]
MKIIKIIGRSIIAFILLIPIIVRIPVEHIAIHINTTKGLKEDFVEEKTAQIYVGSYPEYPGWCIYGKDGVMFEFDKDHHMDFIFITGNFPDKLNYDLVENTFVLNGKYLGEKKYKNISAGCFYVESWGTLGDVKRSKGDCENFSKSSLTILDKVFTDPILVHSLDEFEDVGYSKITE